MSAFRETTLSEYVDWLTLWIAAGNEPTQYYDRPFKPQMPGGWLTAVRDFTTGGECGADAVHIIVPPGIRHTGGALGHNQLYLVEGPAQHGGHVPVFNDPVFAPLPGTAELISRKQERDRKRDEQRKAERQKARRAASRSDIGRHLGRAASGPTDPREPERDRESAPLPAHEVSPHDAALIRMMAGAHFADDFHVTLPSGKTVNGSEMRRLLESQAVHQPQPDAGEASPQEATERKSTPNPPRFQERSLVTHGQAVRMQVLKIRETDDGKYEYKIRYYNSLFGAYWVPEGELSPNRV